MRSEGLPVPGFAASRPEASEKSGASAPGGGWQVTPEWVLQSNLR